MDKINPTGGHKSQYENLFYMSVQHEKPSLFSQQMSLWQRMESLSLEGCQNSGILVPLELPGLKSGNHTLDLC